MSRVRTRDRVFPSAKCTGHSVQTGLPCEKWVSDGATVCDSHGALAPQVAAKAAERRTLAQALAENPRRHPLEILSSALHTVDTVGQELLGRIGEGQPVTAEIVNAILDAARSQASMAKLVLDSSVGDSWSGLEVERRFGAVVAEICREMARQLGHDPTSTAVSDAFGMAMARVVHGKRSMPKMIEGSVE